MSARSGKQIAVAMTVRDERRFLAFLRTTADVQILALNSPSADHVWLNAFPPRRSQDRLSRGFVLWNRAFDWEPEIQTFQHGAGVVNAHRAPVIEYLRHPFFVSSREAGRLFTAHAVVLSGIALLRGSSWPSSTKRRWPWRASRWKTARRSST